jgi:cobalt-zinc-cadmium efflux system membrane fusion protein
MKRIAPGLAVAAVALLLAGLAVAWARPDLLRFSAPAPGDAADSGLYCKEHGVPEKFCTLCHPELSGKLLLCPEHGNIPEDICTLCHPDVEKRHNIRMCPKGHKLPEYFCVECGTSANSSAGIPDDGWCVPHNTPEILCSICLADPSAHASAGGKPGVDKPEECRQPLPTVRFASAKLARQIGLDTAEALAETHAHTLEANAETAFDANRYADVAPRVSGYLREVKADLGQTVKAGEILAVVDSPEVSAAKARLLASRATLHLAKISHDQTKALAQRDAVPARQELESLTTLSQAESAATDATQALRNLGFDDEELDRIVTTKETSSLLSIIAPIDGTVVQRHAVRGEAVQATTPLFAIADMSALWLWVDIYEADVEKVAPGQPVDFIISGTDGPAFEGKVTWIGAEVDQTTRTTRLRAELANPTGRLRANQFGRAVIKTGSPHEVVVVPKSAVQNKDGTDVVFLPDKEGSYRPQRIVAKASNRRDVVEVAWGLKPGDRVVTKGSFWLKTEIMKGAIGAGCCE